MTNLSKMKILSDSKIVSKIVSMALLFSAATLTTSCDFLDVVPPEQASLSDAIAIGVSFLGFILFSIILGKLAGFIAMIVLALVGLATIYIRQRNGLHAKHRNKGIYIYHGIF